MSIGASDTIRSKNVYKKISEEVESRLRNTGGDNCFNIYIAFKDSTAARE